MARIGFVGVGMMGHGMAANLLLAGHELSVIAHRNRAPIDDLVSRGAREAATRADLVQGAGFIFLCVATSEQVAEILEEIEPHLKAGQTIIDTGTSDPAAGVRHADRLARAGIRFVDAPVGGGPRHAAAGELASLVGATEEDFAKVAPVIEAYSATVQHMGPVGAGHRAKLLNNFVAVGQAALVIDAYRAVYAQGIDWAKLYTVMSGGAARSGTLENLIGFALKDDYTGYKFSLGNAAKDFSYLTEHLAAEGLDTTLAEEFKAWFSGEADVHGTSTLLSEILPRRTS